MAKETKYEDAIRQLEDIVTRLENNELEIDEMPSQLKKAQELIKFCKHKLTQTDAEIKKITGENA
jgi:exodeoxyribonuclease VII small subunit